MADHKENELMGDRLLREGWAPASFLEYIDKAGGFPKRNRLADDYYYAHMKRHGRAMQNRLDGVALEGVLTDAKVQAARRVQAGLKKRISEDLTSNATNSDIEGFYETYKASTITETWTEYSPFLKVGRPNDERVAYVPYREFETALWEEQNPGLKDKISLAEYVHAQIERIQKQSIDDRPTPQRKKHAQRRANDELRSDLGKRVPALRKASGLRSADSNGAPGVNTLSTEASRPTASRERDAALLSGHSVNFVIARQYSGKSVRRLQQLAKKGTLVVEGGGHHKKITVKSLKDYYPPEKNAN